MQVGGGILDASLGNWCGKREDMEQSFAGRSDCAAQCSYPSAFSTQLDSLGVCTDLTGSLIRDSTCDNRRPCPASCSVDGDLGALISAVLL